MRHMPERAETLKFAQQAGCAVKVTLYNGEEHFGGVHSVDEAAGTFSLFTPRGYGDETTRTEFDLGDIVSVSVTATPWPAAEDPRE